MVLFSVSSLNTKCEEDYVSIFYLFRKANLRWRLFKRQAKFEKFAYFKYKRPSGTRWVEHQIAALNSHMHNLGIFIGFCNSQISSPHNTTMKALVPKLTGIKNNTCKTKRVLFNAVKLDVLRILEPVSKTLQEVALVLPQVISVCSGVVKNVCKVHKLLTANGTAAFYRDDIFPETSEILERMAVEDDDIIPERQTRRTAAADTDNFVLLDGYLLSGSINDSLMACLEEFLCILPKLEEALKVRLGSIVDDPIYKAIAVVLDSKSYAFADTDSLYEEVKVVVEHFQPLLLASHCQVRNLRSELELVHDHVVKFFAMRSPKLCWPVMFNLSSNLGIANFLQVVEICLVAPLSNAECERAFSFLWRLFSKERQSLKNETLECLIHLRNDNNFAKERYERAVELFLAEYPDGTMRKRPRHLDGHSYPSSRKSTSKKPRTDVLAALDSIDTSSESEDTDRSACASVNDIPLNTVSDDDWSDLETEDECTGAAE